MKYLYTFKYFNKYYNEEMLCEFPGENEAGAKALAADRVSWADEKFIDSPYTPEDFTLVSFDMTIIEVGRRYTTRNGLRVEIESVNPNSTTDHNKVVGKYWRKRPDGTEMARGTHMIWSINGRAKFVGIDDLDLVAA